MMNIDSQVLGVVVVSRHGDRRGFYQDPKTYTPSNTEITPLGNQQSFQLGEYLRSRYLTPSSPHFIQNISSGLVEPDQLLIRADAGGEAGVIYNSAMSTMQGMWPADISYNETLANGTVVVGPLNGYQVRKPSRSNQSHNSSPSVRPSTFQVSPLGIASASEF
jgi:prostatic aicd phosphatase